MTELRPVYEESEHQELFLVNTKLNQDQHLHIPSALHPLGYFVCLRLPKEQAEQCNDVVTHLKVAGLYPDDVIATRGEGIDDVPGLIPSREDGLVWLVLCRVNASRGDGVLSFANLPAGIESADILLCTWPRFIESGQADEWISCQDDPAFAWGGIPLGGIGCGKVELCRDGRFRNFSGNNNQDMPFEEPDGMPGAALLVSCDDNTRLLATREADGVQPVKELIAKLSFPEIQLTAPQAIDGVDITVSATSPMIPHKLDPSALPGFLLQWAVTNTSAETKDVTCQFNWPNRLGEGGGIGREESYTGYADGCYCYFSAPDQKQTKSVKTDRFAGIELSNAVNPNCPSASGTHLLAMAGDSGTVSTNTDPEIASVSVTLSIQPGETVTVDSVLVWAMPEWIDTRGNTRKLWWTQHYANATELATTLLERRDSIRTESSALNDLFDEGTLNDLIRDRLMNCNYPMITNSVLFDDGRFSINEGPTEMLGCYGTLDQRLGSHAATQMFFPELNNVELTLFAERQDPETGGMNHDLGGGHLERGIDPRNWPDLTCSFVLQTAKHSWQTGDKVFEDRMWPLAQKALACHRRWAEDGGGIAHLRKGMGTSYDGYHYSGYTPYLGTLWIAALKTARVWAERRGEVDYVVQLNEWLSEADTCMEENLWNGEFYKAFQSREGKRNENCHAGQLAGQAYARQIVGENVLLEERLSSCAEAWMKYNGAESFAIPPDEVSTDLEFYTEYGWLPYVECFGIASMMASGCKDVIPVWENVLRSMNEGGRRPCDTRLMYQPVSGDPSWGSYYMTAPASWLVYDAMLGFNYEPEFGILRLNPLQTGKFPIIHPLFTGLLTVTDDGMQLDIRSLTGDQTLAISRIDLIANNLTVNDIGAKCALTSTPFKQFDVTPITIVKGTVIEMETELLPLVTRK